MATIAFNQSFANSLTSVVAATTSTTRRNFHPRFFVRSEHLPRESVFTQHFLTKQKCECGEEDLQGRSSPDTVPDVIHDDAQRPFREQKRSSIVDNSAELFSSIVHKLSYVPSIGVSQLPLG
jgi:hypothetical protein